MPLPGELGPDDLVVVEADPAVRAIAFVAGLPTSCIRAAIRSTRSGPPDSSPIALRTTVSVCS
jgi:hypothetical protein